MTSTLRIILGLSFWYSIFIQFRRQDFQQAVGRPMATNAAKCIELSKKLHDAIMNHYAQFILWIFLEFIFNNVLKRRIWTPNNSITGGFEQVVPLCLPNAT